MTPKKTRTLVGPCSKCGNTIRLGIGDYTLDEVRESLSQGPFTCPGRHSELSPAYPHHWKIDDWKLEEAEIPTEDEFVDDLRARYSEVLTTREIQERGIVEGFAGGYPVTNDGSLWEFRDSPEGKRWWYRID